VDAEQCSRRIDKSLRLKVRYQVVQQLSEEAKLNPTDVLALGRSVRAAEISELALVGFDRLLEDGSDHRPPFRISIVDEVGPAQRGKQIPRNACLIVGEARIPEPEPRVDPSAVRVLRGPEDVARVADQQILVVGVLHRIDDVPVIVGLPASRVVGERVPAPVHPLFPHAAHRFERVIEKGEQPVVTGQRMDVEDRVRSATAADPVAEVVVERGIDLVPVVPRRLERERRERVIDVPVVDSRIVVGVAQRRRNGGIPEVFSACGRVEMDERAGRREPADVEHVRAFRRNRIPGP